MPLLTRLKSTNNENADDMKNTLSWNLCHEELGLVNYSSLGFI